jgi:hypothetical protein
VLAGDFFGEWWLPSEPERRLGGLLTLEPGQEPQLHLAGQLSDLRRRLGATVVEHPTILGVTALGRPVTLVSAIESGGQVNLFVSDAGDTVVTAPRAYMGDHFEREARATFRRMDLRLSHLDSWFPPSPITQDVVAPRGRLRRTTLTLEPRRSVEVKMNFGALVFGHDSTSTGDRRTEAKFTQNASIVATTSRRQPLEWWLRRVVKPLRYLLAISTERPILVETIRFRPWSTNPDREVELVWANDKPVEEGREPHQTEMMVWYGDLAGRFEPALLGWFAAVDDLEPILDQFVATFNTSRSYAETRFTMIVGAAEAYHRERVGGTDVPKLVHRERMAQARNGVDPIHLAWLNDRLNNQPTLFNRLVQLCQIVPDVTKLMIGDDAEAFARSIRDARNLRTHLDVGGRTSVPSLRLIALAAQLGVILEAAILHRELGLDGAELASRVERASRLRRTAIAAAGALT